MSGIIKREVIRRTVKADDLEVHICRLDHPESGAEGVDIREYVPSLQRYGRGVTLPWTAETRDFLRSLPAIPKKGK